MSILNASYIVTMPDLSRWSIPVRVIAAHKAQFNLSVNPIGETSITLALGKVRSSFEEDEDLISDWAQNNMNWTDVKDEAECVENGDVDYQDGWVNGDVNIDPEDRDGV